MVQYWKGKRPTLRLLANNYGKLTMDLFALRLFAMVCRLSTMGLLIIIIFFCENKKLLLSLHCF